jgi:hypothetical protein
MSEAAVCSHVANVQSIFGVEKYKEGHQTNWKSALFRKYLPWAVRWQCYCWSSSSGGNNFGLHPGYLNDVSMPPSAWSPFAARV